MGLEFKVKLSVILAVFHAVSTALSYVVTQGDITAMILWFAVSSGISSGLSYYKEQEKTTNSELSSKKQI